MTSDPSSSVSPAAGVAPGFKGWLLVLAVFQFLLAVRQVVLLQQIIRSFVAGTPAVGIPPHSLLYGGRLALNGAFMALLVAAIVLMVLRRAAFAGWARVEMIGLIFLPIAELGWLLLSPLAGAPGIVSGPVIGLIVIHFAIGVTSIRYIETSKRVAATFVR